MVVDMVDVVVENMEDVMVKRFWLDSKIVELLVATVRVLGLNPTKGWYTLDGLHLQSDYSCKTRITGKQDLAYLMPV